MKSHNLLEREKMIHENDTCELDKKKVSPIIYKIWRMGQKDTSPLPKKELIDL